MDKHIVGYKIGATFEDNGICFEVLFPHVYLSYEEAEKSGCQTTIQMQKRETGEVVIVLYDDGKEVEIIRWDEWWKYKCIRKKEEIQGYNFSDGNSEYEPYAEKFEKIFELLCKGEDCDRWLVPWLSYWIRPLILG